MGLESSTIKDQETLQQRSLPYELNIQILAFCDDETLLKASATPILSSACHYVLLQRLEQEFILFGITAEQLALETLPFEKLFLLRQCLFAMEHHDSFAALELQATAQDIKDLLEQGIKKEEGQQSIVNYLHSIFSALVSAKVPVLEQLPSYLAVLNHTQTVPQKRLTAIHYYAKKDPACVPLFLQLVENKDPVAHWYLYQIYRLGLCGQNQNLVLAKQYLEQMSKQYVRSPEFATAYYESLSRICRYRLSSSKPLATDNYILSLAQQLQPSEKSLVTQSMTYHQNKSNSLKIKI